MLKKASIFLVSFFMSVGVFANDLNFKQESINDEFSQISSLEKYISEHPGATLETIKAENPALLENIDLITEVDVTTAPVKSMPLLGGFWWGCVLGIVGLALTYFISEKDRDETKKAFWGCLIASLIWGVGGLDPFGWF